MDNMQKTIANQVDRELKDFLEELYTDELKKTVLIARANGESLEEVGMKLGVTREFVRQVEAKITRKFAMSHSGRKIRESLIALCNSGEVRVPADLKDCFGEYCAELAYLLRLYKDSFFYDGKELEEVIYGDQ